MHYLCTRAKAQDIRPVMSEMATVVVDMLERVKVDLTGDRMALCIESFNLQRWADRGKAKEFLERLKDLAKALGLNAGVCGDFVVAVRLLRKVVQAATANRLQTSNRQAWSWFLCSEWRLRFVPPASHFKFMADLEKLVCFYLALKVNTTTLERNLGQLCKQLDSHSGPHAQDGRLISAVLLVALDGPREPAELFDVQNSSDKDVQSNPTDFSVACAKLWLATYGRRFRYKYVRATQVGDRHANSSNRKRKSNCQRGTFEWVKRQRKLAANLLCQAASSSTSKSSSSLASFVPDIQLPLPCAEGQISPTAQAVAGTRWQSSASSKQGSSGSRKDPAQLFREHTERKRARPWANLVFFTLCERN